MTEPTVDLRDLPSPSIDPAFAAGVQARGSVLHRGGERRPGRLTELALVAALLGAGLLFAATSMQTMLRIYVG